MGQRAHLLGNWICFVVHADDIAFNSDPCEVQQRHLDVLYKLRIIKVP